jgi:hypothetical protein
MLVCLSTSLSCGQSVRPSVLVELLRRQSASLQRTTNLLCYATYVLCVLSCCIISLFLILTLLTTATIPSLIPLNKQARAIKSWHPAAAARRQEKRNVRHSRKQGTAVIPAAARWRAAKQPGEQRAKGSTSLCLLPWHANPP